MNNNYYTTTSASYLNIAGETDYAGTFDARLETGKAGETAFEIYMREVIGVAVTPTGYEALFPKWFQTILKQSERDLFTTTLRNFPDFQGDDHVLYQIKTSPSSSKYDSVTVEQSSYNTCEYLQTLGFTVVMVWVTENGEFLAERVENIKTHEPYRQSSSTGSGNPYYLVKKSLLKNFSELFALRIVLGVNNG